MLEQHMALKEPHTDAYIQVTGCGVDVEFHSRVSIVQKTAS